MLSGMPLIPNSIWLIQCDLDIISDVAVKLKVISAVLPVVFIVTCPHVTI